MYDRQAKALLEAGVSLDRVEVVLKKAKKIKEKDRKIDN